jgi:hypothetical protein
VNGWFEAARSRVRRVRGILAARACDVAQRRAGRWAGAGARRLLAMLVIDDGIVEFAGPWSRHETLLDCWFDIGGVNQSACLALLGRDEIVSLSTRLCSYRRPDIGAGKMGQVALIGLSEEGIDRLGCNRLLVLGGSRVFALTLAAGLGGEADVVERLREWFATRAPSVRRTVREFLGGLDSAADLASLEEPLRSNLAALPRHLHDRLATHFELAGRSGRLDLLVSVGSRGAFLRGALGGIDPSDRVELVGPFGDRTDLGGCLHWLGPSQGSQSVRISTSWDFVAFVPLAASYEGMRVELRCRDGQQFEMGAPTPILDPHMGWRAVLASVSAERMSESLIGRHLHPALAPLLRAARELAGVAAVHGFGRPPTKPRASILIPLGTRIEWVEYQLAHFAADRDARSADVLFVLDAPERESELEHTLEPLSSLYGIPFRVVVRNGPGGEASAINTAARFARTERLLLLGAGAFPGKPGWLDLLIRQLQGDPDIGAVGPKLVAEDGSIVSAGVDVRRSAQEQQRLRVIPRLSGLPAAISDASVGRPAAAVSLACLLVGRKAFTLCGGLSESYVDGEAAAVDFCLRLAVRGLATWYTPEPWFVALDAAGMSESRSLADTEPPASSRRLYDGWLLGGCWTAQLDSLDVGGSKAASRSVSRAADA